MTNADIALLAINKFFYYAMNYPLVEIEFPSVGGGKRKEYLPSFFYAFPPYLIEHLFGKWEECCGSTDSYGYLMKFYGQLDGTNRNLMLNYILDHYNGGNHGITLNSNME
jgi:hypothetical protein